MAHMSNGESGGLVFMVEPIPVYRLSNKKQREGLKMKLLTIELPVEVYHRLEVRAAIDNLKPEEGAALLLEALVKDWQERNQVCE